MTNVAMENHHAIDGKIHYKWPFSIAMLVYQRVLPILDIIDGFFWIQVTRSQGYVLILNMTIDQCTVGDVVSPKKSMYIGFYMFLSRMVLGAPKGIER
jgi:hypothetical protein